MTKWYAFLGQTVTNVGKLYILGLDQKINMHTRIGQNSNRVRTQEGGRATLPTFLELCNMIVKYNLIRKKLEFL